MRYALALLLVTGCASIQKHELATLQAMAGPPTPQAATVTDDVSAGDALAEAIIGRATVEAQLEDLQRSSAKSQPVVATSRSVTSTMPVLTAAPSPVINVTCAPCPGCPPAVSPPDPEPWWYKLATALTGIISTIAVVYYRSTTAKEGNA